MRWEFDVGRVQFGSRLTESIIRNRGYSWPDSATLRWLTRSREIEKCRGTRDFTAKGRTGASGYRLSDLGRRVYNRQRWGMSGVPVSAPAQDWQLCPQPILDRVQ